MNKRSAAAVAALALGLAAGAALAQVKPEILVKQRQAVMTLHGKYLGPLVGMAQGKVPYNADIVRRNAGFDPSTQGVKSNALPEVFSNSAKFKEAALHLENETHKLYELSQKGDEAAVKAQIGAVGKSCGGCHDNFRQKQ
jgi:cytochrome c556